MLCFVNQEVSWPKANYYDIISGFQHFAQQKQAHRPCNSTPIVTSSMYAQNHRMPTNTPNGKSNHKATTTTKEADILGRDQGTKLSSSVYQNVSNYKILRMRISKNLNGR